MAVIAELRENAYHNLTKVKTGKVRISFPHLFTKYEASGKYQAHFIISKDDENTVEVLQSAIKNAKENGKERLWGGKLPGRLAVACKDGDEPDDNGEVFESAINSYIVTAKSKHMPPVYGADKVRLSELEEEEVYGGCYVQAIFEAYPYSADNAKGIAFALLGVKKLADGERFGGGASFASDDDFDEADDDDIDDLLK